MSATERVIIVGAGWAGMAAALELDRHNIPVTVLESAPRPGGRARTVVQHGMTFDNGQHLLIGAYRETLRLLSLMGLDESRVLQRLPLQLKVIERQHVLALRTPKLPAPLHLLWGLMNARGVSLHDKSRALLMSLMLAMRGYRLKQDISVKALLKQYHQGPYLIRRFWEPLCLATLNTPMHKASAAVFLRVLQDSFAHRRQDADLLIPKVPLGELFCESAVTKLGQQPHHQVHLRSRVSGICQDANRVTGVITGSQEHIADDVILATSPNAASRLLSSMSKTTKLAETIAAFDSQPITTVYLRYPDAGPLSQPMVGLSGTLSQWVFDRTICAQPGWLAVVISAEGEHCHWDKQRLAQQVQQELADHLPGWPAMAEQSIVIREKRATFECRVGIEALRPANSTPLPGLWLAGDYTDTGYPATLEGAVRSGVQCARRIIQRRQNKH